MDKRPTSDLVAEHERLSRIIACPPHRWYFEKAGEERSCVVCELEAATGRDLTEAQRDFEHFRFRTLEAYRALAARVLAGNALPHSYEKELARIVVELVDANG